MMKFSSQLFVILALSTTVVPSADNDLLFELNDSSDSDDTVNTSEASTLDNLFSQLGIDSDNKDASALEKVVKKLEGMQPKVKDVWALADHFSADAYLEIFMGEFQSENNEGGESKYFEFIKGWAADPIKGQFRDVLMMVANNPVGRILLFRLLVAVNKAESESNQQPFKKLQIVNSTGRWTYSWPDKLEFDLKKTYNFTTLEDEMKRSSQSKVKKTPPADADIPIKGKRGIYLFHELLHWLHYLLQGEGNYSKSVTKSEFIPVLQEYFTINDGHTLFVSSSKLKSISEDAWKHPKGFESLPEDIGHNYDWMIAEWGGNGEDLHVTEELLTVLGRGRITFNDQNGSELSENLYRLAGNYPIRLRYIDLKQSANMGRTPEEKKIEWLTTIVKNKSLEILYAAAGGLGIVTLKDRLSQHYGFIGNK